LLFTGPVSGSTIWTAEDWQKYYNHRNLFWKKLPTDETFPEIVTRFSSFYSASQQELFVRDFALIFGGVPESKAWPIALGLASKRPPLSYLHINNIGVSELYLDVNNKENQSHHYAAFIMAGYYLNPFGGSVLNSWRDSDNPGDIYLGNAASLHGFLFHFSTSAL
jgi:hypothetical protein